MIMEEIITIALAALIVAIVGLIGKWSSER